MSIQTRVYYVLIGLISLSVIRIESSRILGVFPSPSVSHLLIHFSVVETLVNEGHDVTVIATVPNKNKLANVKYIHIDGPMFNDAFAKEMVNKPAPVYKKFASTVTQVMDMANVTMSNRKMIDFLAKHKAGDFDVVLMGYFMNDFMLGFGAHFQCPVIISFMVQPIFSVNEMIGNPAEASYVPSLFMGVKQPMDFWMRVKNFVSTAFEYHVFGTIMSWKMEEMYR